MLKRVRSNSVSSSLRETPAAKRARSSASWSGVSVGVRPNLTPLARARALPSSVRSLMRSRSKLATAPRTKTAIARCGVDLRFIEHDEIDTLALEHPRGWCGDRTIQGFSARQVFRLCQRLLPQVIWEVRICNPSRKRSATSAWHRAVRANVGDSSGNNQPVVVTKPTGFIRDASQPRWPRPMT